MQTKLTLRLDDKLINRAKSYARKSGKSVSQLVAEYFSMLDRRDGRTPDLTPTVTRLKGALRGSDVDVNDYRKYIEKKFL